MLTFPPHPKKWLPENISFLDFFFYGTLRRAVEREINTNAIPGRRLVDILDAKTELNCHILYHTMDPEPTSIMI